MGEKPNPWNVQPLQVAMINMAAHAAAIMDHKAETIR